VTVDRNPNEFSGLYDIRDVAGNPDRLNAFCLALWCAATGLPAEEGRRRDREAAARIAKYGRPIEVLAGPQWPDRVECADCGSSDRPFQAFKELLTDVPRHRWVRRYRCMRCYDEHTKRKWRAIGGAR
jgi:hypothetical protein